MTHVTVPAPPRNSGSHYQRHTPRKEMDIAAVGTAVYLELGEDGRCTTARIALGAVAPKVIRAPQAEAALVGQPIDDKTASDAGGIAATEATPISDQRGSADFRRYLVEVMTKQSVLRAAGTSARQPDGRGHATEANPRGNGSEARMAKQVFNLHVNGRDYDVYSEPNRTLLEVVRDELRFTGAKEGCGTGDCGACTMHVDGKAVTSCLMLAPDAEGRDIRTIEGLARDGQLHPLQQAFIDHGAVQCGFCIPGMILSGVTLLERNPHPTREEIRRGIAGNLCRCTGYRKIIEAIESVANAE